MSNKKMFRALACIMAIFSFGSLTACDGFGGVGSLIGGSSTSSEFGSESSLADSSSESVSESVFESDSEEEGEDGSEEKPEEKPAPQPEKTLVKTELDAIGHKIAYYSDGTYDDLGRETPLDFSSPKPATQYGYQSFAKESNGEGLCDLYEKLYEVSSAFHSSTKSLQVLSEEDEDGTYYYVDLEKIDYEQYGLSEEEALAVWKVFGDDNPIFYWSDISVGLGDGELVLRVDRAYADYSARKTANEAIENMALECDGYLSGLTTVTERALTIYDFLIEKLDYAYEEDGETVVEESWAYNIAGGAMYGYGVCECYAETYAYFCGLFGIRCLNVVGIAGDEEDYTQESWGGHAWNYLNLEDKWYAVDVTWADFNTFERYYFGMELAGYEATHALDLPTTAWGHNYQCAMPALEGELTPVLFGEEGGEKCMLPTIEAALAQMTNEGGRYEVTLYPDTAVSAKSTLPVDCFMDAVYVDSLPKVEHITFIGREGVAASGTYDSQVYAYGKITLQCNITVDRVMFYTEQGNDYVEAWQKNGYTVTSR